MKKNAKLWLLSLLSTFIIFSLEGACPPSPFFIVGGHDNGVINTYSALVNSSGVTTALSGPALPIGAGVIRSASINSSGFAIIGGHDNGVNIPYSALINPSGVTTALSGPAFPSGAGAIRSVAINASGSAIIGGEDNGFSSGYAALINPSGVTSALSGPVTPPVSGFIFSVAINNSGSAIIGGEDGGTTPYVALINPSGVTSALSGPALPSGAGTIFSVAINPSGAAIIGGEDNGTTPYAALVNSSGATTALSGPAIPSGTGRIFSVAINNSGAAIIGGADNGSTIPYIALVAPNGATTALSGPALPSGNGQINSVAIHQSGSAIIGGADNGSTTPYIALVAPNGATTALSGPALPPGTGSIRAVATNPCEDEITSLINPDPKSFGSGNAFGDSLFALSAVVLRNHLRAPDTNRLIPLKKNESLSLIAYASDKIYPDSRTNQSRYAVWVSPFGLYAHYKKEGAFPSIRDRSVGGILGFDYTGWDKGMIGGGLAYTYQNIHYSESMGKAKAHQELAVLYGEWLAPLLTIEGALWGGIYQLDNTRKTLGFIRSKASVCGGIFSPHLAIYKPIALNTVTLSPFVSFDWVNNWQGKRNKAWGIKA